MASFLGTNTAAFWMSSRSVRADWHSQDNVLLVLTHPPAACGFEWCSFHLGRSSKTPPLSWGSTPSSSQTRMLLHNTAATLPLIPTDAFWSTQQNWQWGIRVSDEGDKQYRQLTDGHQSVCLRDPLRVFILPQLTDSWEQPSRTERSLTNSQALSQTFCLI